MPPTGLLGGQLGDLAAPDVVEELNAGRQQRLARGAAQHVTDGLFSGRTAAACP